MNIKEQKSAIDQMLAQIVSTAFILILLALTATYLTGCGGAQGWQFQIGAVPINAVDNHSTLNTRDSIYNSKGEYQNERNNK